MGADGFHPEHWISVLRVLARQLQLDVRWQRRFDASDLIQETLLKACTHHAGFRGQSEGELVAWLEEIMRTTLADEVRKARAKKRDLKLERVLAEVVADSSARLGALAESREPSPSQQAGRQELRWQVASALAQLPDDQRDVVILRDLLGTPVAEIAARLARTEKSVAGLLLRGRRGLREFLHDYK